MTQTAQFSANDDASPSPSSKPWYRQLYVQVLIAIVIGILVGWRWPDIGTAMQPIGTTFIAAMKMLIGPIVFLTIVGGIASVADLKSVGLTGLKALTYFQIGTIIALATGLVAINVCRLGVGVHADPDALQVSGTAQQYVETGETQQWWEFFTHLVPESFFGAFVEGDILQVIFLAVLFGIAIKAVGPIGEPVITGVKRFTEIVFKVLSFVMKAAPLGAFGAMAYAIGKFGLSTLASLGSLIALFYATSILFVVVVLGGFLAAYVRLNIFQLFRYLKEEFFLVLGTSTAEPALPGLMRKLTFMGAGRTTVGLVVPHVHVRVPSAGELLRQRGGDAGHRQVGRCARPRPCAPGPRRPHRARPDRQRCARDRWPSRRPRDGRGRTSRKPPGQRWLDSVIESRMRVVRRTGFAVAPGVGRRW